MVVCRRRGVSFWLIRIHPPKHPLSERRLYSQRGPDMICIRPAFASAVLLLVCILAKPVQSWERRPRSLRGFSDSAEVSVTNTVAALHLPKRLVLPYAVCPAISCDLQVLAKSVGRTLTQSSDLAGGTYNIQSEGRLGSCWSYLSIPKCSNGDTVDLYTKDDGSGRQQWTLVSAGGTALYALLFLLQLSAAARSLPLFRPTLRRLQFATVVDGAQLSDVMLHTDTPLDAAGDNLYYLVLSKGRSGCTNWLSGQPCPDNRISAWGTDDSSGRQKWLLSPVGDNTYTISLPEGRASCDTYLSSSTCAMNSAVGAGLTSFVSSDTGSGFERWLITPVSGSSSTPLSSSSPPPPSPSSGKSSPSPSPMSKASPVTASAAASGTSVSVLITFVLHAFIHSADAAA